jgi:hypothetical protein
MLEDNMRECYKILETMEGGKNYDLAMVKEYIEVLQDPNSCLENASRLCFALSVVGDFEEAGNVSEEIHDLRERWDKALGHLEQQVREVTELESLNEDTSSVNCLNEEPREVTHEDDITRNRILSVEQQNVVKENIVEGHGALDVHENKAGSQDNINGVLGDDATEECTVKEVANEAVCMRDSTFSVEQPENLIKGNMEKEMPVEGALINGKAKEEPGNAIEKDTLANENEVVSLDYISEVPKEGTPEEFTVKEIPEEDIATRNRTVSVEQQENLVKGNMEKEMPVEGALVNGKAKEEPGNAIEKDTLDNENQGISLDYISEIPKEATPEEFIVKEIPEEDIATRNRTVSVEQQENLVKGNMEKEMPVEGALVNSKAKDEPGNAIEKDTLDNENQGISLDYISDIAKEGTPEEFIVKEIPEEDIATRNRTVSVEPQESAVEENRIEDGNFNVHENEPSSQDNITVSEKEVPVDLVLVNGKVLSFDEKESAVEFDTLADAHENNYISILRDEAISEECIVKEIPEEDIPMKNRTVSEEQQECTIKDDVVEDRTSDVHENISIDYLPDIPDKATADECIMREIPEAIVVNRSLSEKQPGNVVQDVLVDVYENKVGSQDSIIGVSENVASEKWYANEVPVEGVLIDCNTKSLKERDNIVGMDTSADAHENGIISIDNITDIPKEATPEEFIVKEIPEADVVSNRASSGENQEKRVEENIEEGKTFDVHGEEDNITGMTEEADSEKCYAKEITVEGVLTNRGTESLTEQDSAIQMNLLANENEVISLDSEKEASSQDNLNALLVGVTREKCYANEVPVEDVFVNGKTKSLEEKDNAVEMDTLADGKENGIISIHKITDMPKEATLEEFIAKKIPDEDVVTRSRPVSEEQRENTLEEENIEEEGDSDACENEATPEEFMAKEKPEEDVVNSTPSEERIGNVIDENIMEDGTLDVHENKAGFQDNITGVTENVGIEDCTAKDVIHENIDVRNGTMSVIAQQEDVVVEDTVEDGNKAILQDDVISVPKNADCQKCYAKEVPLEDVLMNRKVRSLEDQDNAVEKGILADSHEEEVISIEVAGEATSEECIVNDTPEEDVVTRNRKLLVKQQESDAKEIIVEGRTLDIHENEVSSQDNVTEKFSEEVKGIPPGSVRNRTLSVEELENVAEEHITEDGTSDVDESKVPTIDRNADISQEMNPDEFTVKDTSQKGVLMIDSVKAEEQQENAGEENSVEDGKVLKDQVTLVDGIRDISQEMNTEEIDTKELPQKDIFTHDKTLSEEYQDDTVEKNIVAATISHVEEEETSLKENISGISHDMNTQESIMKKSPKEVVFVNGRAKTEEQQGNSVEMSFQTDGTSNLIQHQVTLEDGICDISDDSTQDGITSGVPKMNIEQKEITWDEVPRGETTESKINQFDITRSGTFPEENIEDEVIVTKDEIVKKDYNMLQSNNTYIQREKSSTETDLNNHQTMLELSLKYSVLPSFCVASEDDTYKESKAVGLEDVYYTINKVSNELAMIKSIDHIQKISPQNFLEYELRSLSKLRSIETQLQTIASDDINFDTVEKDKKSLLSNLVKEQHLEIVRIRDVLYNRVRKIERFFEIKRRTKDRIEEFGVILDEALSLEQDNFESKEVSSLEDRVKLMEELLSKDENLSGEFVSCLESLSSEYQSLDLTYAEQIHDSYNVKKYEVTTLLDVAKKQLKVKLEFEEELNSCSEWLFTNEEKIKAVNINTDTDVASFDKAIEDLDSFLVGLDDKIQRFCSYSINEGALLNILPKQERDVLLSKANNLEKHLTETRAFVLMTKQDTKAKVDIAKRKENISACQLWCEKTKEFLNYTNKSSQCVFSELSDLVTEGEAFIENITSEERSLNGNESCDVVELAKEILQTAKKRLQGISDKEETLKNLSYEISELERRIVARFDQNNTDNTESWKFEEEIESARNRLQNISANSPENELLRRSEYLLGEVNELTEKRLSMETLAECEKIVEEAKDVCNKPMMFCLDVVKMKKELAELGKISLELKDTEVKLQKVT